MKRFGCDLDLGLDVALLEEYVVFLWDKIFSEGLLEGGDTRGIDTWISGSCSDDGIVIGGVSLILDFGELEGK
jgi:hypothetical protein